MLNELEERITKKYDKLIADESKIRERAVKELDEEIEGVRYRLKKVKRSVNDEERYKRQMASKNLIECFHHDELEKLREPPQLSPTGEIQNV